MESCAKLTDQITILGREYQSRHKGLRQSASASLNATDHVMEDLRQEFLSKDRTTLPCGAAEMRDVDKSQEQVMVSLLIHQDQTCKLAPPGFPRGALVNDLRASGDGPRSYFSPTAEASKIMVRAFDMSQKRSFHFEPALAASSFLDSFSRTAGPRARPDLLQPIVKLFLMLRRDLDLQGRQRDFPLG
ncbi:unnamed protein product, partial [Prorocentrum cordatum]